MAISLLSAGGLPTPSSVPIPAAPDVAVSITVDAPDEIVAPAQIWLTASDPTGLAATEETGAFYEPAFHEYYYEWTVNGQPLANWDKPVNLIAEHNNPNKAFGKEIAFCLTDPGDYVIDLVVTDKNGDTATASTSTITVQDPETFFPAARRIYVASDGDFTGVPVGATTVQTLEAMKSALTAKSSLNDVWVRFKRGNTWSFGDYLPGDAAQNNRGSMLLSATTPCFMMSDWGDAGDANPLFYPSHNVKSSANSMFEIKEQCGSTFFTAYNLDFEGEYDPTVERGDYGAGAAIGMNQSGIPYINIHNLTVSGLVKGFYVDAPGAGPQRVMISSSHIYDCYDYCIFGGSDNQRVAYIGNLMTRHPNSLLGLPSAFTNYHAGMRIPESPLAYISGNDVFSKGGWTTGGRGEDQPCLRLFPSTGPDDSAIVERNSFEGGYEVIQIMKKADTQSVKPANIVIERNIITQSSGSAVPLAIQRSGITVRDNIFVLPNAPRVSIVSGSIQRTISLSEPNLGAEDPPDAALPTDPIAIYSNTVLHLANTTNDGSFGFAFVYDAASYYENVIGLDGGYGNNVVHAPNIDTPVTTFAPIDTSTAISGFGLRYAGYRPGFKVLTGFSAPATANGASFTIPYSSLIQTLEDLSVIGGATDQSYWTAIEGTDTRHQIQVVDRYYAEKGHFTVTFGASEVTITNTSGVDWPADTGAQIHLDRTSLIPALDTSYASPSTVPMPRPQTGSAAIDAATTGRVSPKDFLLADRGATPSKGALEPAA